MTWVKILGISSRFLRGLIAFLSFWNRVALNSKFLSSYKESKGLTSYEYSSVIFVFLEMT